MMVQHLRLFAMWGLATLVCSLLSVASASAGNLVVNGDFEGYVNALPDGSVSITSGTPTSWIETNQGNHSFLVAGIGLFNALPGSGGPEDVDPDNPYAVYLTEFNEGIYQTINTTSATQYYIELVFGQFETSTVPTVRVTVFDGVDFSGAVLTNYTFLADSVQYGDGVATGSYVGGFVAASSQATVRFTLEEDISIQNYGVALDNISITAVPGPSGVAIVGLLAFRFLTRSRGRMVNQGDGLRNAPMS